MSDKNDKSDKPRSGPGFSAVPTLRTGQSHPHPDPIATEPYSAVELMPGYRVVMLDQRKLPQVERYEFFSSAADVAAAIRDMTVRGAPAIGIAAAYGMVAAAMTRGGANEFLGAIAAADLVLRAARPTAVNLAWACDRMRAKAAEVAPLDAANRAEKMAAEARAIHREEIAACKRIGENAADFVPNDGAKETVFLTHCNAGALATGGYGTALGVVRAAKASGKKVRVLACETRPYLQGARLTAWELHKERIPVEVIADSMAAVYLASGEIDLVVVGADRIAKNGDVANKIGTYALACLAKAHGVPLYVAAPWSTVDLACANGAAIPIEQRSERELSHFALPNGDAVAVVPEGVRVRNPAFDVTPASHVTAIVTERGVASPPSDVAKLAPA